MNYLTYQANDHDCGFVSLKMLLATLSKNKSYLYLEKGEKKKGHTFADLIKIADEHGLTLKAYSDEEDKDLSFLLRGPALLLLDDHLTYNNHLVMVRRLKHGKVYFNDPNVGEVVMKEEEFLEKFTGKFLQVESCQIKPFQAKETKLVGFSNLIPSIIFQILSMVFLLVGLYFVQKDEYVFIPLVFLILFAISELVENWYFIKLLKHFDDEYLTDYMTYSKDRVNDYKKYVETKNLSFSKSRTLYTSCSFAISAVIILLLNDAMNCFPILLLLVLSIIDYIITSKLINQEKLANEESSILLKSKQEDLGDGLLTFNAKTNKIGFDLSAKRCLITFLMIFLAVVMMLINKIVSTNYIIFNFGAYYVLYEQFSRIISYENKQISYRKMKERFLEVISISKEKQSVL